MTIAYPPGVDKPSHRAAAVHGRREIELAREDFYRDALKIRRVSVGVIPDWFRCRVLRACGRFFDSDLWESMADLEWPYGVIVFDHIGKSTTADGSECVASEPYPHYDRWRFFGTAHLISRKIGLEVQILDEWRSWHAPGRTYRIEWRRPRA